jgi:tellurite methyltransferase
MRQEHRAMWEERHRGASTYGNPEPSVVELSSLLPQGLVLDVAGGTGRHSIYLARLGFRVVAPDFSATGLAFLAKVAKQESLPIEPVMVDLEETFPFQAGKFDAVVDVSYLDRALIPRLKESLRIGGVLLFDTFLVDQAITGHPRDPSFFLNHYELREILSDMELLRYREGIVVHPNGKSEWRAAALARRTV